MTTASKAKKVTLIKNKSSKAAEKSYAKMRWLMQVEVSKSLGWHKWVAEVMAELSKFADNVECCSDYRVVKCGDHYEIAFGNTVPFGKMDASQLYDFGTPVIHSITVNYGYDDAGNWARRHPTISLVQIVSAVPG